MGPSAAATHGRRTADPGPTAHSARAEGAPDEVWTDEVGTAPTGAPGRGRSSQPSALGPGGHRRAGLTAGSAPRSPGSPMPWGRRWGRRAPWATRRSRPVGARTGPVSPRTASPRASAGERPRRHQASWPARSPGQVVQIGHRPDHGLGPSPPPRARRTPRTRRASRTRQVGPGPPVCPVRRVSPAPLATLAGQAPPVGQPRRRSGRGGRARTGSATRSHRPTGPPAAMQHRSGTACRRQRAGHSSGPR